MQFQVPQFIETEDKIVGPLTLRQFLYIAAAGGVSALFYFTLQVWLWFLFSLPLFAIAAGLAFIKVNGRPLSRIILSGTNFYWRPQTYVWQPENPRLQKNESTLRSLFGGTFSSLESIVAGRSLKNAQERAMTGTKESVQKSRMLFSRAKEKYEIIQHVGGERRAARRVDYR